MKKHRLAAIIAAIIAIMSFGLVATACGDAEKEKDPEPSAKTYTVTYSAGEGTGTVPTEAKHKKGDTFQVAAATGLTHESKVFDTWNDGTTDYAPGATYTMPEANVTFTAKWKNDESGAGEDPNPDSPLFTAPVNATISIKKEGFEGYIALMSDGTGRVYICNATSGATVVGYDSITYTVAEDGTFTITGKGSDSKLVTPVSGTIEGRKVSITLENQSLSGSNVAFEFESVLYKLTINYNDGDRETFEQYVPVGMPINAAALVQAPDGKHLASVEVNGQSKTPAQVSDYEMPSGNVTFKYVWSTTAAAVDYTVTYKAGTGTGEDFAVEHVTNAQYTLLYPNYPDAAGTPDPAKPTFSKTGFRFGGWRVNNEVKEPGSKVTLTGNTEIIAVWNEIFTVSYAGVTGADITTNFVTAEQAAANPNLTATNVQFTEASDYYLPAGRFIFSTVVYFSKTKKVLTGWTSSDDDGTADAGKVYDPSSKYTITKNVTFTAVWGDPVDFSDYEGEYRNNNAGLTITEWSYTFKKATIADDKLKLEDEDAEEVKEIALVSTGEKTASGEFSGVTFDVTFNNDNIVVTATRLQTTVSCTFVKQAQQPPEQEADLEDYKGTYYGTLKIGTYGGDCAKIVIESKQAKLYDSDNDILSNGTYSLTVDDSGTYTVATGSIDTGSSVITLTITFTAANAFTVDCVRTGSDAMTTTGSFSDEEPGSGGNGEHEDSYTVTFDPNNGQETWTETVDYEDTVTEPATAPEYTDSTKFFYYWKKDGTGTAYNFDTPVTSDITLVAVYAYRMTFDLGEAQGSIDDIYAVVWGPSNSTMPAVTDITPPAGKAFAGWTDGTKTLQAGDSLYSKYADGDYNYTTSGSYNFTAVWANTYTVTYALDGGSGTLPTETPKFEGAKFRLAASTGLTPPSEDKEFDKWSDGTNQYAAGAEYTMPAINVIFTAVWKNVSSGNQGGGEAVSMDNYYSGTTANAGKKYTGASWTYDSKTYNEIYFYKTTSYYSLQFKISGTNTNKTFQLANESGDRISVATPDTQDSTITFQVFVQGSLVSGVTLRLSMDGNTAKITITDSNGTYVFTAA